MNTNTTTQKQQTLATLGVDVQLTPTSALYLTIALILPIVTYFLCEKYF